jgi:tetratricopeptide (TPR) repeat protein
MPAAAPKPQPPGNLRKIYYEKRRSNAPLMAVGVAILVALAVVIHRPQQASATRGPIQRLYVPISIDPVDLSEKVRAGKFDAVQALIKTAEDQANADPRNELNLTYAMSVFAIPDPAITDQLKQWAQDTPDSAIAHCARAIALDQAAAHARGEQGGSASSIPSSDFLEMEKDLNQAMMEADSARALDANLMNSYLIAIDAAKMESDSVAMEEASKRALAKFPLSLQVHTTLIAAMTPKWGGSYDKMDEFAHESQAGVAQNPLLKYLLGFPALEQARDLQVDEKWDQSIPILNHAIEEGGDWAPFYTARGKAFYEVKKYDQAIADFQIANDLMPDQAENLEFMALTSHFLDKPNDALGFCNRYLKIGESDKEVADIREWAIGKILPQSASEATPVANP